MSKGDYKGTIGSRSWVPPRPVAVYNRGHFKTYIDNILYAFLSMYLHIERENIIHTEWG